MHVMHEFPSVLLVYACIAHARYMRNTYRPRTGQLQEDVIRQLRVDKMDALLIPITFRYGQNPNNEHTHTAAHCTSFCPSLAVE